MRNCLYQPGYQFEVSVEAPQMFSAEDIKRYIELGNKICLTKQEEAESNSIRRKLAHSINLNDVEATVNGNILTITVL